MTHKQSRQNLLTSSLRRSGVYNVVMLLMPVLLPWLLLTACETRQAGNHDGHDHAAVTDMHARSINDGHSGEDDHTDEISLTGAAIERYGIRISTARRQTLESTFVAPARMAFNAEAMAHVGSPLPGRAVEIKVRLGDQVRKGDPLVVVESRDLAQAQSDFLLKRMAAQAAVPQVDLAKAAWDRARGLLEQSQGISLTEVQKREAEYKAAVANLKSAEAAAGAAENALHMLGMDQTSVEGLVSSGEIVPRYVIRAALAGQVVQREVTLGELVNPERDSLMILADTTTLWVLADVPEARIPSIAQGARAWVVVGSATENNRYEGTITFIAPLVDPMTRTVQVRVEVPNSELGVVAVRPGMFAQVEIVSRHSGRGDGSAPQVVIPEEAVQTIEGEPAVFVPVDGEPNTFQLRLLTLGPIVGGLAPVLAGLEEGEKFVEAGTFILKAELGKGSASHEH